MALRHRIAWSSKLSLILAVAYLQTAAADVAVPLALLAIGTLTISAVLVTLYAHQVNDTFDIEADALSLKPNSAASLSPAMRVSRILLFAVAGLLPWLVLDPGVLAFIALAVIYVLPCLYSTPPVRLKDRAVWGVISDAVMAHFAPAMFTSLLFIHLAGNGTDAAVQLLLPTAAWALFLGIRAILVHQLRDHDGDVKAGTRTFAVRHGIERTRWLITRIIFPGEVISLIVLWIEIARLSYILAAFFVLYLIAFLFYWMIATRKLDLRLLLDPAPIAEKRPPALDKFYLVWPGLAFAVFLATQAPLFSLLVGVQVVLFWPEVKAQLWILRSNGISTVRHVMTTATTTRQETP